MLKLLGPGDLRKQVCLGPKTLHYAKFWAQNATKTSAGNIPESLSNLFLRDNCRLLQRLLNNAKWSVSLPPPDCSDDSHTYDDIPCSSDSCRCSLLVLLSSPYLLLPPTVVIVVVVVAGPLLQHLLLSLSHEWQFSSLGFVVLLGEGSRR